MKISIIGAGAMGGAVARGLLYKAKENYHAGSESIFPQDITISNPHTDKLEFFKSAGINVTTDNKTAAKEGDIVILAVQPWVLEHVAKEIKPFIDYSRQKVVSIVAGVKSDNIIEWFRKESEENELPRLFISIPNIAIAVARSMTFVVPVTISEYDNSTKEVIEFFNTLGKTDIVEERQLSAATALASCGIAYAMRYIRAASEGGVELGFEATDAKQIVMQTVQGAVNLLLAEGNHPEAEIDKVTSPGGITIRGLNEMEHAGFSSAVIRGLKAGR